MLGTKIKKHPTYSSVSGNALFLILIAVALFAALSYAVTTSGRGSGSISREQMLLDSAALVNYGSVISSTVKRMVLTGAATPDTLQFETAPLSGTLCSSGDTCVFAPEGGAVSPVRLPFPVTLGAPYDHEYYFYRRGDGARVLGVGQDDNDDVVMLILGIPEEMCAALNKQFGLPSPADLPIANFFDPYDPVFSLYGIPGSAFGCFKDAPDGSIFNFYYVFLEL